MTDKMKNPFAIEIGDTKYSIFDGNNKLLSMHETFEKAQAELNHMKYSFEPWIPKPPDEM